MIRPLPRLLLTSLAVLSAVGCGAPPDATPTAEAEPRPVRTAEARPIDASAAVFSGSVRASTRSRLAFQVPGRLLARPAELGDVVRGGQVLARLEPTDYRLRVERAESALQLAEARLREADAGYARTERLYAGDNATRAQLDTALAALEVAKSSAEAERRGLDIARRDLGHTRLVAPDGGTVVDLFAEVGEFLAAGQGVATVAAGDALEVEWTVPEGAIASLRPGLAVDVQVPAVDARFRATVTEVGTSPRDGGATYPVRARVDGEVAALPGMAANIRLLGDPNAERQAAVLLPPEAVSGDPAGHYVLVVLAGDGEVRSVERRAVEVGALRPEGLEVLSGVDAGEHVVAAGVTFLADGEQVSLLRSDPLAELPPAVSPTQGGPFGNATAGSAETGR
ncbi:MAG: efflux RND transporter periplasmic adaptor subunit [Acidobacteriota bacterium]